MKIFSMFVLFILLSISQVTAREKTSDENIKNKPLFGAYVGAGFEILSGNISEYINNPFMLPITGDFVYKGFTAQLNLDGGYSTVKKTINFNDGSFWEEGSSVWHNLIGVNVGYAVFENENLRVTPLAGYAFTYLSKNWWTSSEIAENEPEWHSINAGLIFDLKNVFSSKKSNSDKPGYWGLRIAAGAYIPMGDTNVYPNYYNGTTIYFSVGVVNLSAL